MRLPKVTIELTEEETAKMFDWLERALAVRSLLVERLKLQRGVSAEGLVADILPMTDLLLRLRLAVKVRREAVRVVRAANKRLKEQT